MRISLAAFVTILLAFIAPLALVDACTRDDHCVPSSCCHATFCVDTTKVPAPNCTEVMCTGGCHMESLDCGGECRCSKSQVCSPYIRTGMPPDSSPQHQWVDLSNQPPAAPQKIIRYVKRLRK